MLLILTFVMAVSALMPMQAYSTEYNSYAIVKDDGSLRVKGRTIWLYGIQIPPTYESCLTFMNPARCGPRAVLMLELKIGPHFVHCREMSRNFDDSINAFCTVEGEDLAAYMVGSGWAEVLPNAPDEYHTLQESARLQNLGIWAVLPGDMIPRSSPGRK